MAATMAENQLLSVAAMRAADAATIATGTSGARLMERAGRAVADVAMRFLTAGGSVLVVCGPGNNGGDGFVAARVLAGRGYAVRVALLGAREALTGDAARAAGAWDGPVEPLDPNDPLDSDLVIDALFGAGLSRDLDGAAAAFVGRLNARCVPVLAVDVPSGLDGDTGQVRGAAVRARATVTFAALKPGHLLMPGRDLCGAVTVADIGIPPKTIAAVAPPLWRNGPALWGASLPRPAATAHKYTRGHALVLSGGVSATGAARLAARGALRIGAGLVTLLSPREALAVNAVHLTAIMLRACDGVDDLDAALADPRVTALVMGPGAGVSPALRRLVEAAMRHRRALVLDADALTSYAGEAMRLAEAVAQAAPASVVLTPHEGEFARLFAGTAAEKGDRLSRALAAARLTGALVVLKGPDTIIAAPDGRAAINATGTPDLATAGSGDVLAGFAGGLLAQGMAGFEAACAAVWLHGRLGERLGAGLIAEDLPEALPALLHEEGAYWPRVNEAFRGA